MKTFNTLFFKVIILLILTFSQISFLQAEPTSDLRVFPVNASYALNSETGEIDALQHQFVVELYFDEQPASLDNLQEVSTFSFEVIFDLPNCNFNHIVGNYFGDFSTYEHASDVFIFQVPVFYNGKFRIKSTVYILDHVSEFFAWQRSSYEFGYLGGVPVGNPTVIIELNPNSFYFASSPCGHEPIETTNCEIMPIISNSVIAYDDDPSFPITGIGESVYAWLAQIYFPSCNEDNLCEDLPPHVLQEWGICPWEEIVYNAQPEDPQQVVNPILPGGGVATHSGQPFTPFDQQTEQTAGSSVPWGNHSEPRDNPRNGGSKTKFRNNLESVNISISPNPAQNQFMLQVFEDKLWDGEITIQNISGQVIKTISLTQAVYQATIPIHDLSQGIYFVHWKSNDYFGTKKLSILR